MTGTETTKTFQTRFEDLMIESGKTLREIANDTGISRAALNNYANDKAEIGINNVVKLAKYFNVSADYLLGLSDAKTNDKELQAICDYTGLESDNITFLHSLIEDAKQVECKECLEKKMLSEFFIDYDGKSLEFEGYVSLIYLDIINDLLNSHRYFDTYDEIFHQTLRFKKILGKLSLIEKALSSAIEKIPSTETECKLTQAESLTSLVEDILSPMCPVIVNCREINDLIQFYGNRIEQSFAQSIRTRIENSNQNALILSEMLKKIALIKEKLNLFPNSATELKHFELELTIDILESNLNKLLAVIKWQQ